MNNMHGSKLESNRAAAIASTYEKKFEDIKMQVRRLVKHGRYAVEDGLTEALHKVKRRPLESLAIAFVCGAMLGLIVSHRTSK